MTTLPDISLMSPDERRALILEYRNLAKSGQKLTVDQLALVIRVCREDRMSVAVKPGRPKASSRSIPASALDDLLPPELR